MYQKGGKLNDRVFVRGDVVEEALQGQKRASLKSIIPAIVTSQERERLKNRA
jgi:hypothetical protein